ncbi:MAG: LapA family protein [Pseudomonadota bacterium]|nr:LapA family protein [Pseudomonadota bacterium]
MRLFVWLLRAATFFTLFAFALNNQQESGIRWFFGTEWRAPMVFIVLAAFALGCAFGVVAMVPSWWRHRRIARKLAPVIEAHPVAPTPATSADGALTHPPRDGL